VRKYVFDLLDEDQVAALATIAGAVVRELDAACKGRDERCERDCESDD
jgi:hypothetical protein